MGLREDALDNTANESILVGEKVGKSSLSLALNKKHKNHNNLKQIIILSFDAIKERRLRSTLTVLMVVAGCA
jgi:Ran GTPase-activating protein (RanGAP) involved in mRNA processing and transport